MPEDQVKYNAAPGKYVRTGNHVTLILPLPDLTEDVATDLDRLKAGIARELARPGNFVNLRLCPPELTEDDIAELNRLNAEVAEELRGIRP